MLIHVNPIRKLSNHQEFISAMTLPRHPVTPVPHVHQDPRTHGDALEGLAEDRGSDQFGRSGVAWERPHVYSTLVYSCTMY